MKIVNIAILIGNSLALSKNLSTFKKKTIDFFFRPGSSQPNQTSTGKSRILILQLCAEVSCILFDVLF